MAVTEWKARADAASGIRGEAHAPNNWFTEVGGGLAPFVKVTVGNTSELLRVVASGTPTGDQLIVAPGTFGLLDNAEATAQCQPWTLGAYRRDWLVHTKAGQLTLLGLLLVIVGQVIQISLDIGGHSVVFDIGAGGVAIAKSSKGVLTIVGATLAAWQGLLKS